MGLVCKKTATGARMFELPESAGEGTADLLARKLQELAPEAKIARPIQCAELRITGLDDSVGKEDVLAAVARQGSCSAEHIKVGQVRFRGDFGTGAVWVKCPVIAAKTLADAGRLLVGWCSARVQTLEPRPMRCFRCLEIGHTGMRCPSTTDRSGLCFRCGGEGHTASDCRKEPHCLVCAAAGAPANHMVGGKNCHPPKRRKKGKGPINTSAPTTKPAGTEEATTTL
ncbi:uncharacterized protein LOC133320016 [Danaus plexippus]|uniref:uncharacterized protein LOC133320016 n=1 Tax=Danaus plexippus TaxID=13037 RepID=UPI002AB0EE17|nr:uncharacterized protein LOC133320016 [Danaus plexippus]